MRVIERDGLSALSQRSVAREAGVPPSAVTYYFPTVDDLLVAALTACNSQHVQRMDECIRSDDPFTDLAVMISDGCARGSYLAAEYELFLVAARRLDFRTETDRWARSVDAFLAPHVADPVRRAGVAAAIDGLFLRYLAQHRQPAPEEVRAIIDSLIAPTLPDVGTSHGN